MEKELIEFLSGEDKEMVNNPKYYEAKLIIKKNICSMW